MTNMDKLYEAVAARGPVCVGLDTDFSYLPADFVDTTLTKGRTSSASTRSSSMPPRLWLAATRCRSHTTSPWVWRA